MFHENICFRENFREICAKHKQMDAPDWNNLLFRYYFRENIKSLRVCRLIMFAKMEMFGRFREIFAKTNILRIFVKKDKIYLSQQCKNAGF